MAIKPVKLVVRRVGEGAVIEVRSKPARGRHKLLQVIEVGHRAEIEGLLIKALDGEGARDTTKEGK